MNVTLLGAPRIFTALLTLALASPAMSDTIFFASPKDAVPALAEMLANEDWAALARCYAFEGSGVDRRELETGRYFRRSYSTEGHPARLDRWRHPFPPGYRYLTHTVEGDEALVRVGIEIDQGGGMVQRGFREFRMRKTAGGWQVLPDRADGLVRQWTTAALRAHVTRTRATLENPRAEAEAGRLELLVRAEPRAQLALADRLAEVEHRRGETMTEFTSLMVIAREQTDEDRRELARLEQEVQRLDLERELLVGLQKRLGPIPR